MRSVAALASGRGLPLRVGPIELDAPGDLDVLVRIVASGLCHTDITILNQTELPWPAILGHEGAGVVERVGAGVTRLRPGDHVVLTADSCGGCESCLRGQPGFCVDFRTMNLGGGVRPDGSCSHHAGGHAVFGRFFGQSSFAAHVLATERNAIRIDADLPLTLMAPFGCGVQTGAGAVLNTLKAQAGRSLAVFGAGAVGLSALMAARIAGCEKLIAVDTKPHRLRLAKELGATTVIDAAETDAVAAIRAMGGVDYAVEASGVVAVMGQAIAALRHGGAAVLVGVALGQNVSFDPSILQSVGGSIMGSMMAGRDGVPELFIPRLIQFWRDGRLPVEKLVTFYEFDDINTAIRDAHAGVAIKPVLRMPSFSEQLP